MQVPASSQRPPWRLPAPTQSVEHDDQQEIASGFGEAFAEGAAVVNAAMTRMEERIVVQCIFMVILVSECLFLVVIVLNGVVVL